VFFYESNSLVIGFVLCVVCYVILVKVAYCLLYLIVLSFQFRFRFRFRFRFTFTFTFTFTFRDNPCPNPNPMLVGCRLHHNEKRAQNINGHKATKKKKENYLI
jgi:hypothetical protein